MSYIFSSPSFQPKRLICIIIYVQFCVACESSIYRLSVALIAPLGLPVQIPLPLYSEMEIITYIEISMTALSWKVLHWCSPHQRKGHTLTGSLSLLSGQAAVLLSPKSRGVSHWKIVWGP